MHSINFERHDLIAGYMNAVVADMEDRYAAGIDRLPIIVAPR